MRHASISAVLLLASAALPARAQILHYGSRFTDSREPVTNAALDGKVQQVAAQYRSYAPVPRVAFYDVAYPTDSGEYIAMHGYALLVVTAIDQDSSELPPARVYVTSASGEHSLPLVCLRPSIVADAGVRATFGSRRVDAVYLLPVPLRSQGGQLLLDFARNRDGFRLGLLDSPLPATVQPMTQLQTAPDLPSVTTVWAMFEREYPDLARSFRQRSP
jgi:hypothetical protein